MKRLKHTAHRIRKALTDNTTRNIWVRRLRSRTTIAARNLFSPHPTKIVIDRPVGKGESIYVIAEVGMNHNGSVERAKALIDAAVEARADAVKFQKRSLEHTYQKEVLDHPELYEQSFQYLIPLLREFELSENDFRTLKAHADKRGVLMFATPFDEPSVDFISRVLHPPIYKVASADLVNFPLLERLLKEKKPLLLSTGMSSLDEIDRTAAFLHKRRAVFMFLHTHSSYPAAPDTLNLAMIKQLIARYHVPVGYSGHEIGIHHTLQAVALGATLVERHITLDKNLPGPDHTASLLPEEFKELVSRMREMKVAFGTPRKQISRGEVGNRMTLRKSLVATRDITEGERIERAMVTAKSPGFGVSPQRLYELVGLLARRDIQKDELFRESDFSKKDIAEKALPLFDSHWGLKARFAETDVLSKFVPKPKFLEFHVSDKDLSYQFDTSKKYDMGLYVHAPEYWGRELVDLATEDDRLWEQSIDIVQRTIDKTREMAKSFTGIPKMIIHVGGVTLEPHPNPKRLLLRAKEAFRRLDTRGVEVYPENLPSYGWFFSGLWNCNIFGASEEMIEFCKDLNLNMCLDISHAWLYTSRYNLDFKKYIEAVAPYTRHLHISDGRGSHKEGLQVGEGDVPFAETFAILEKSAAKGNFSISWVPEIWQGHLHDYREFKIALAKLGGYDFLKNAHGAK